MKYKAKDGSMYLIYLYDSYRGTWKIEDLPFTPDVRIMSENGKNQFIKSQGLKPMENK